MEYGLIPNIDQYSENQKILSQQIQPSNSITKLKNGDDAKQVDKDNSVNEVEESLENAEVSSSQKVTTQDVSEYQEVVLTNVNFGFNDSSRDFYVKATRGESENQYPTDEMMRLKAYMIAQSKAEAAAAQIEAS